MKIINKIKTKITKIMNSFFILFIIFIIISAPIILFYFLIYLFLNPSFMPQSPLSLYIIFVIMIIIYGSADPILYPTFLYFYIQFLKKINIPVVFGPKFSITLFTESSSPSSFLFISFSPFLLLLLFSFAILI